MIICPVPGCSGMFRNVPGCSGMFHVPGFVNAHYGLGAARWASTKPGTWNIPEHPGTFRNIPEHSGTSRNRANYHKINEKKKKERKRKRLKKQPKKKRTNEQTKFKIRSNSSTFPPILSCDFLLCWFLGLFLN